jgi:hypothetical protein
MKSILPLLIIVISAACAKAQVITVSAIDSGKPAHSTGKVIADSAIATKNPKTVAHHAARVNTAATAKPADGTVTTDKLANDILASLNQSNLPVKKSKL